MSDLYINVEETVDKIKSALNSEKKVIQVGEDTIYISKRLRTLAEKGTTCVSCGTRGLYFVRVYESVFRNGGHLVNAIHLALVNDNLTVQTQDHIIPKSRGGSDHIYNMDVMCVECNNRKDNQYQEGEYAVSVKSLITACTQKEEYRKLPPATKRKIHADITKDLPDFFVPSNTLGSVTEMIEQKYGIKVPLTYIKKVPITNNMKEKFMNLTQTAEIKIVSEQDEYKRLEALVDELTHVSQRLYTETKNHRLHKVVQNANILKTNIFCAKTRLGQ